MLTENHENGNSWWELSAEEKETLEDIVGFIDEAPIVNNPRRLYFKLGIHLIFYGLKGLTGAEKTMNFEAIMNAFTEKLLRDFINNMH